MTAPIAVRPEVPFEPQQDRRGCGAAALTMVCRALGRDVSQPAIWAEVARRTPGGIVASRSFELASHALGLGLDAATIRARDPWETLTACARGPQFAIVNHRSQPSGRGGHYSVLLDADDHRVLLHDPRIGPDRAVARREFLALWSPDGPIAEIVGHILVVIAAPSETCPDCPTCLAPMPATIRCPSCRFAIPARPASALGCVTAGCPRRSWDRLFCPRCDAGAVGDSPWWMS